MAKKDSSKSNYWWRKGDRRWNNLTDDWLLDFLEKNSTAIGRGVNGVVDSYYIDDELLAYLEFLNEYNGSIAQYQGSDYYDLLFNNPNSSFQRSGFDSGSSEALSFINGRINAANTYRSNVLGTIQANNYNSTVAAVARDKAAGFNDALTGSLAGGEPATAPESVEPPSSGISPDAAIQERQNEFERGMALATFPLQVISGVTGVFNGISQIATLGPQIKNLLAGAGASEAAAAASGADVALKAAQTAGQVSQNRDAWRRQFNDLIGSAVDLTSGSVNVKSVVDSLDRSAWTPEQSSYFDELLHSGYFYDKEGKASAGMLQDFAARSNDYAGNLHSAAGYINKLGGYGNLDSPEDATLFVCDTQSKFEIQSFQLRNAYEQNMVNEQSLSMKLKDAQIRLTQLQSQHEGVLTQLDSARVEGQNLINEGLSLDNAGTAIQNEILSVQNEIQQYTKDLRLLEADNDRIELEWEKNVKDAQNDVFGYLKSDKCPSVVRMQSKSIISSFTAERDVWTVLRERRAENRDMVRTLTGLVTSVK